MPFDPALPVNGSLISAVELRNQLNGLNDTKARVPAIAVLTQTISNPPTQAQVTAIQDKLNQLIDALQPV